MRKERECLIRCSECNREENVSAFFANPILIPRRTLRSGYRRSVSTGVHGDPEQVKRLDAGDLKGICNQCGGKRNLCNEEHGKRTVWDAAMGRVYGEFGGKTDCIYCKKR
ncbi:uncharacterized protein METZ01_LOCUS497969, partial [marine metagenome]